MVNKRLAKQQPSSSNVSEIDDLLLSKGSKAVFYTKILGLGWRLAVTLLLPIFAGLWIDNRLHTYPSMTISAFFVAIFASGLYIYKTYQDLSIATKLSDNSVATTKAKNRYNRKEVK